MNRNRLLLLAAAGAAALVVVVLALVAFGSSSSDTTSTSAGGTETTSGQAEPSALFTGVPQSGDTLGKASAPATLLVFEDPQCPYCRDFNLDVLPTVVGDFVRTGRLKLAWRGVNIIGPNSNEALAAIYAAGRQNKLWQMAEAIYRRQGSENSGWITESVVREAATEAGADPAKVVASMSSSTASMKAAAQEADELGLRGTPSFYVQRPPGVPQQVNVTSLDPAAFSAALAAALQ